MKIFQLFLWILHLSIIYLIPWKHLFPVHLSHPGFYPIRCALFEDKEYKQDNIIYLYPISCVKYSYNYFFMLIYHISLIYLSQHYKQEFRKKYYETRNINYIRYILYLTFIEITTPIFSSCIQKNVDESYINVYISGYEIKYGNKEDNTIKIVYPKKIGNYTVFDWIESLELLRILVPQLYFYFFYRNNGFFKDFSKILEIIGFLPYVYLILTGIYEGFFKINNNILFPFLLIIGINLYKISELFYITKKTLNIGLKIFYFIYFFTCFYTILQKSNFSILLEKFSNENIFLKNITTKYVYLSFFIGYILQVFLSIIIYKNVLKKNLELKYLLISFSLEWVFMIFFIWINRYVKHNKDLNYFESRITFTCIFFCAGISGFGIIFFMNLYIEIFLTQKNKIKYFMIYYFLYLFATSIIFFSDGLIDNNIFQSEFPLIALYQLSLILFLYGKTYKKLNIYNGKAFECFICIEKSKEIRVFIPCGHYICNNCFNKKYWINCPMCRNNVKKGILYLGENCNIHKYSHIEIIKNSKYIEFNCSRCCVSPGKYYPVYGLE